ncbi:hypothetical protein WDW37_16365 [Bdellovibrionota bacterium FG-1]
MAPLGSWIAVTALALNPFGKVGDLLQDKMHWSAALDRDPVILVYRVSQADAKDCSAWISALSSSPPGVQERVALTGAMFESKLVKTALSKVFKAWEPWSEDDLGYIQGCKSFPCDIKFAETETKAMDAVPREERLAKFEALVSERVQRYFRTGERKEYEFPGDPLDPWEGFEKIGASGRPKVPDSVTLWGRQLDFSSSDIKRVRQILDWRMSVSPARDQAAVWVRDLYTNHYFDGWGELFQLSCDSSKAKVTVLQILSVELDLLKSTSLVARMMRSKMRKAIEEQGRAYLAREFERVSAAARLEAHPEVRPEVQKK